MKINSLKKDKLFIFIFLLFSFIIMYFIVYFSKDSTFWNDDWGYSVYSYKEGLFDILNFNKEHGAGYIGFFMCKFLCWKLPLLLGINPYDFIGIPQGILKSLFAILALYLISKSAIFHFKNKILFLFIYFLFGILFFYNCFNSGILLVNYNFYRYFLSFIFFCVFIHYIYKHSINKYKKTNYFKLFIAALCGFVIGTSIEITFYMSAFLCASMVFYNFIIVLINKIFIKKDNYVKSFKFNLDKNFYIPAIFLYLAIYFFTNNDVFKEIASERGIGSTKITLSLLKDFLINYNQIYIQDHIYYWIIFIVVLALCLYFSYKRCEVKKVIFPVLLEISLLIAIFSLIFCGKTLDYMKTLFFLSHDNIIFLYKMHLLIPLSFLLSYLIKNIIIISKNKNLKKLILVVIISLTILLNYVFCIKTYDLYKDINYGIEDLYNLKLLSYKLWKIIRFYYLKDEIPILPSYTKQIPNFPFSYGNFDTYLPECRTNGIITDDYYPQIYKNNVSINKGYCFSDNAMELFYKKGGKFSKYELKHINFSRLFDEDFVLNKSLSQDELEKDNPFN